MALLVKNSIIGMHKKRQECDNYIYEIIDNPTLIFDHRYRLTLNSFILALKDQFFDHHDKEKSSKKPKRYFKKSQRLPKSRGRSPLLDVF